MSLVNDSSDPSNCLKQLQQLVNRVTQPDKSSRNLDSGHSSIQNCSSVDDEILEVIYPLPTTSTELNGQTTVQSTSSTWQTQPVKRNLVPLPSDLMSTNSQNRQTSRTYKTNKTPIWQAVAHMENLLLRSDQNPSTNPTWPNCKPTSEVEKRKKRVICECPNCSVRGGNKTYSITGRLQHNCHIPGCGRNFDWPSILQTHLRAHGDHRPFSCSWHSCDKKFKSKEELVRHIRNHTGLRNFICPHCNLGFKRSDHLNKHVDKIHESSKKKGPANNRKRK